FWCYFDGELLGGSPVYDTSAHQMSSGQFGLYSFQQDDDGLPAYFDNITVDNIDPVTSIKYMNENEIPTEFTLLQNYPNPFNPETKISFVLPESRNISLIVYDMLGRKVNTIISENMHAGQHSVVWDGKDDSGKNLSSGIYIYTLKYGSSIQSKKMILLK
ncbi:MAG: T9SS type A sorting domain-containing protein, partial [Melioribacteraceae bacterium]|nr:T9SS type A sorting domain-containing protein [Melioribacteraceae bacterium]MCF8356302.1 T9SS type A sorting domain-containing protein [Melioribacteraceae bacterium]MCF8395742.1 T9SS type A sorting domain-containing protein [Melioribacteraceae bacterium]MCF8421227.1 T9SS type A sorting domain-containing protein [Melioribacteraceae bacterium]